MRQSSDSNTDTHQGPNPPALLRDVRRTMLVMFPISVAVGAAAFPSMVWGILGGGLLVLGFFAALTRTGGRLCAYGKIKTALWIVSEKLVLVVIVVVLLLVVRLDPLGIAVGVSILPVGVILASLWSLTRRSDPVR